RFHDQILEDRRHVEFLDAGNPRLDVADHHRDFAALAINVDAKAADVAQFKGNVQLELGFEGFLLLFADQRPGEFLDFARTQGFLRATDGMALQLHADGGPDREEQVGALLLCHYLQVTEDLHGVAGRKSVRAGNTPYFSTIGSFYCGDVATVVAIAHRRNADGDHVAHTEQIRRQTLAHHVVAAVSFVGNVTGATLVVSYFHDEVHVRVGKTRFLHQAGDQHGVSEIELHGGVMGQ